jgi:DNA-binding MarR family transcriptional regulator
MSELADRMALSPSGLTRRVDNLVKAGLVERVQCPDDRRGMFASLTDAGRERVQQAAPDHVAQVRRHCIDRLDRDQLVTLVQMAEALLPDERPTSGVERAGQAARSR